MEPPFPRPRRVSVAVKLWRPGRQPKKVPHPKIAKVQVRSDFPGTRAISEAEQGTKKQIYLERQTIAREKLAERGGFEPPVGFSHTRFPGARLKPLSHLSPVER